MAPVGVVAVYNRADSAAFQVWLSPFEVWVGSAAGATDSRCAGPVHVPTGVGPFIVDCHGRSGGFVTVRLSGDATNRYLCAALRSNVNPPHFCHVCA